MVIHLKQFSLKLTHEETFLPSFQGAVFAASSSYPPLVLLLSLHGGDKKTKATLKQNTPFWTIIVTEPQLVHISSAILASSGRAIEAGYGSINLS